MLFTDPLYLVLLGSGLAVGFGHCIGMCGPVVVALSIRLSGKPDFVAHLLYNAGRLTTYMALGAVVGFFGSFAGVAAKIVGLQKVLYIASGLLICFMGLFMGGWLRFKRTISVKYQSPSIFSKGLSRFGGSGRLTCFPLGLLWGFLPCGPVYTALVTVAGVGVQAPHAAYGTASGAFLMLAFGAGTLPAVLAVARLADLGWLKSKSRIYKIGAMLIVVAGIYILIKGLRY